METLSTTEPHYIRCIKPNAVLKPEIFENYNVLNQLRCGGVLEAIRISCAGYPTKRTFDEFLDRFGMLAPDVLDGSDEKSACIAICERMNLKGYQIGKAKVFLRAGQMAELDARRAEIVAHAARRIQRQIRTYLTRKDFITLRKATINIQKFWRAQLARTLYEYMRKEAASIRIQKNVRAQAARKTYTKLKAAAIILQTGMRAMAARNEFREKRRNKAATNVQKQWRRFRATKSYNQQKKANLTLQCLWRARLARKELRKLRMAARDTGALKEAKDKLEKRVEELTWRIDFEKHLRLDLEEAKGQEIEKLQNTVHELQIKLEEAHELVIREKEAARLAIEQAPPVIKEVPVVDNSKVDQLTSHNQELQDELTELKKRMEEFEQAYTEVQKENQARQIEVEVSHEKLSELQETIGRLEMNLSNLESENQVIRQQALAASSNEEAAVENEMLKNRIKELESENERLHREKTIAENHVAASTVLTAKLTNGPQTDECNRQTEQQTLKSLVNGHEITNGPQAEEFNTQTEQQNIKDSITFVPPLTKQRSLTDRQQESHDMLIKCLMEEKRFENNKPVAACVVYKSLLHWRSFEADKTTIFDKIIHNIRSSIESQDDTKDLAYWLSTTSTLLLLVQCTIKASSTAKSASHRNRSSPTTFFGRMAQGLRTSSLRTEISSGYSGMEGNTNLRSRIEAKYPALLFKQHLTACVEKAFGTIRDNLKKDISPFLNLCIQAPRSARIRGMRGSSKNIHPSINPKQQASMHWQHIVSRLEYTKGILCENNVPPVLVSKLYSQVFSFINVQLINSLLLRRECCSFSNGEYVKAGLQELEMWCNKATDQYTGSSWDELQHIRQAVGFLVLHQKAQRSLEDITSELCPMLSIPQIYRIGTMFWDDKYGTQGLSPEVINKLRALTIEDSTIPNTTFLLDVDSSIPFSVEELARSFHDMNLPDVEPPPLLRQRSDFHFLLQQTE